MNFKKAFMKLLDRYERLVDGEVDEEFINEMQEVQNQLIGGQLTDGDGAVVITTDFQGQTEVMAVDFAVIVTLNGDKVTSDVKGYATTGQVIGVMARMVNQLALVSGKGDGKGDGDEVDFVGMMGAILERGRRLGYWNDDWEGDDD